MDGMLLCRRHVGTALHVCRCVRSGGSSLVPTFVSHQESAAGLSASTITRTRLCSSILLLRYYNCISTYWTPLSVEHSRMCTSTELGSTAWCFSSPHCPSNTLLFVPLSYTLMLTNSLHNNQSLARPAALRDDDRRQTGVRALDIVVTFGNGITTQAVRDTFNEAAVSD